MRGAAISVLVDGLTEDVHNPSRIHFTVSRDQLYRFQISNEKFDNFIKLLLRNYTGLFTEFVPIFEERLAASARLPEETIVKYLQRLNDLKIIRYIPRKQTPMIIFTEERLDTKALLIPYETYNLRKEIYLKKQEKIWEYVTNRTLCRSRFLLDYFGEKNALNCGICDICKEMHDVTPTRDEFETIHNRIKEILTMNPQGMNIREITEEAGATEGKVLTVIRWLTDNGYLVSSPENDLLKYREEKGSTLF